MSIAAISGGYTPVGGRSSLYDGYSTTKAGQTAKTNLLPQDTGASTGAGSLLAQPAPKSTSLWGDTGSGGSLTNWLKDSMGVMATNSPMAAPVRAGVNNAELYKFSNQYLYGTSSQTWAKIDGDGDGAWSRQEVEDYADAYNRATGRTIDVDDFMAKYESSPGSGVVLYGGQQQAYAADALGISHAKNALAIADSKASTLQTNTWGGGGKVNEAALKELVDKYTYGSPGKMYLKIDQNDDGVWDMNELSAFAKAYEKAFGVQFDIETIMAKYDANGNGVLGHNEQNAIYKDDALGLGRIQDALKAQDEAAKEDEGTTINFGNYQKNLPFSKAQMGKLANAFSASIQKAAMLDAFTQTNLLVNSRYGYNRNSLFGGGYGMYGGMGTYSAWNYANLSMLNLFV